MILGVDVSWCQGAKIDWPAVAAHGIRFAFCKVTDGLAVDPTGLRNLEGAADAGIANGAYVFARMGVDPRLEAQRLWDSIGPTMPSMPILIDFELIPVGYSPAQAVEEIEALVSEVQSRFGRSPIIYTYPAFARGLGAALVNSAILARCRLHIAHYRWLQDGPPPSDVRPDVPAPWKEWTLWQYSGNGGARVPGIPCDVDRNVFHGDETQFRLEILGLDSGE
jgi:GH25 family lysozyme M1 (1,4-beta-N-acetylmuramidase)